MHRDGPSTLRQGTERTPVHSPRMLLLLLLRASVEGGVLNYRLAFSDGVQATQRSGRTRTNGKSRGNHGQARLSEERLSNVGGDSDEDMAADDSCAAGSDTIWQGLPGTQPGLAGPKMPSGGGRVTGRKAEGTWRDVLRYHGMGACAGARKRREWGGMGAGANGAACGGGTWWQDCKHGSIGTAGLGLLAEQRLDTRAG
jgi:hypothetical protein